MTCLVFYAVKLDKEASENRNVDLIGKTAIQIQKSKSGTTNVGVRK